MSGVPRVAYALARENGRGSAARDKLERWEAGEKQADVHRDDFEYPISTIAHYTTAVRIPAPLEIGIGPEYKAPLDAFPLQPMMRQEPASRCD